MQLGPPQECVCVCVSQLLHCVLVVLNIGLSPGLNHLSPGVNQV